MSTILLLNKDVPPGFYDCVADDKPRYLVLPNRDGSLDAVQLDACSKRRAFTIFKLRSRGVALGRWLGEMTIQIDGKEEGKLSPSESTVGAVVVSKTALAFQFLNPDGSVQQNIIPFDERCGVYARERSGSARRWKIFIFTNGNKEIVFESHRRESSLSS